MALKLKLQPQSAWRVPAVYGGLALLVMLPLLAPGYVLTLDLVFTPVLRWPESLATPSFPFHGLLHIANFIIPSFVIQKFLLLFIFVASGIGMHRLSEYMFAPKNKTGKSATVGFYAAGFLYTINPFVYSRFMAGQYSFLLGYALLPWAVRAALRFFAQPERRQALKLAAWTIGMSIVSIHMLGPLFIVLGLGMGAALWQRRQTHAETRRLLLLSALGAGLFVLFCSYWLVPLLAGHSNVAREIQTFTTADRGAFATVGDNAFSQLINVLRLQGFWAESRGLFTLPQSHVPLWGLLCVLMWTVIGIGMARVWRSRQKSHVVVFGGSAVCAILLSVNGLASWLAEYFPLFAGYREPQKFVVLLALAFAIFFGYGTRIVWQYYVRAWDNAVVRKATAGFLLALPLVIGSTLFWGAGRQLSVRHYPADWTQVNQQLNRDPCKCNTLFLPWHLYMSFDFAGRIIANPAPQFFDKPIIVSDDPELKGATSAGRTATTQKLGAWLKTAGTSHDLAQQLAKLNIKYVLLAREYDYKKYAYLAQQPDLRLIAKTDTLELYRNTAFKERQR